MTEDKTESNLMSKLVAKSETDHPDNASATPDRTFKCKGD